jgi:hypothetical protein
MTSHSLLPRLLPGIFFLCLAVLCYLLNFNGLYGQDAHEYLRQSCAIFDRLQGLPIPPPTIGDLEFAGGYPLLGALLRFTVGDAVLALQMVSWLAAAFGLWVFERLLTLLAPGARAESRWVFAGLGLVLAPMFFRAGLSSMSDGLGLVLALSAFFFGLRAFENRWMTDVLWAAMFGALAISTRYALAALLLPLAMALTYYLGSRKKRLLLLAAIGVFGMALLPHFWLKSGGTENPFGHSMLQHWSAENFFHRTFNNENGQVNYPFPNIVFLGFPLAHPAFCLVLPGMFFLFKKTDLVLPSKKILLACIGAYLILLGGMPHQNLRHLLPAYALLLLLLFPAWDRFYCYGFIFFRRLTSWLLAGALVLQLLCLAKYLAPTIVRSHLEKTIAVRLKTILPPDATLYSFDLDIALRSYLPGVQFQNLWERRYPEFQSGSYVLFNEALRPQWQGQNPILNWDDLKTNYSLVLKAELPDGWSLWEIR